MKLSGCQIKHNLDFFETCTQVGITFRAKQVEKFRNTYVVVRH